MHTDEKLAREVAQEIREKCPFFIGQRMFTAGGASQGHVIRIEFNFYDKRYRAHTTTGWWCTNEELERGHVLIGYRQEIDRNIPAWWAQYCE